jgi:hypothetical protein
MWGCRRHRMQIVIDINEHLYKMIKTLGLVVEDGDAVAVSEAIKNGTLLDDIKAEISDEYANTHHMYPDYASGLFHGYAIINKHIYKAESEDKE